MEEEIKLQKNKLLIISIMSALLLASALSVAAAQEESPIDVSTDPTVAPEIIINPDDSRSIDDNQTFSSDDPILYSMDDDNSTDTNSTEPIDIVAEDGLLYANTVADQNTPDNTWIVAAIGVVLAVVVGLTISVVYFHKTKAKN